MTTIDINGAACESGCWVDGSWGQYAPDHFANKVDGLITIEPLNDPRILRQFAEHLEACGPSSARAAENLWEWHTESADKLMARLNELTPGCWSFQWQDGEIRLGRYCDWDDTDLDDLPCEDTSHCNTEDL